MSSASRKPKGIRRMMPDTWTSVVMMGVEKRTELVRCNQLKIILNYGESIQSKGKERRNFISSRVDSYLLPRPATRATRYESDIGRHGRYRTNRHMPKIHYQIYKTISMFSCRRQQTKIVGIVSSYQIEAILVLQEIQQKFSKLTK